MNSTAADSTVPIPKLKLTLKLNANSSSSSSSTSSGKATPYPTAKQPSQPKPKRSKTAPSNAQSAAPAKPSRPKVDKSILNKSFTPRPWTLQSVTLTTFSGYSFQVPSWTAHKQSNDKYHPNAAVSLERLAENDLMPTFVCPQEGCHKIFDTKLKWRRHQYNHVKKGRREAVKVE